MGTYSALEFYGDDGGRNARLGGDTHMADGEKECSVYTYAIRLARVSKLCDQVSRKWTR